MATDRCDRCGGAGRIEWTHSFKLGDVRCYEDCEDDCPDCEGTGLAPAALARARAATWAWELYCALVGPDVDWDLCPAPVLP